MENFIELAKLFHDTYERLAPEFGYETRKDTKLFDPFSNNGRLMIEVCRIVTKTLKAQMIQEFESRLPEEKWEPDDDIELQVDEWTAKVIMQIGHNKCRSIMIDEINKLKNE